MPSPAPPAPQATSVDLNADFHPAAALDQIEKQRRQTAHGGECPRVTDTIPTNEKTPEIRGSVEGCQSPANADLTTKWALRLDSNTPAVSKGKQHPLPTGAAESAGDGFAAAIAAIMALPLTDSEKADAVRRLLADKGGPGDDEGIRTRRIRTQQQA